MAMITQEDVNRIRWGTGSTGGRFGGRTRPFNPGRISQQQVQNAMGGYKPGAGLFIPGVMETPPPRQDAPYTPPTMYTEGAGGMQTPDIGHFLNPGGMGLPNVKDVRATRRTATSARKIARKELRQARRSVAPAGTTKAANIAAKKSVFKTARKEARATKGTVRKARKVLKKRAGI